MDVVKAQFDKADFEHWQGIRRNGKLLYSISRGLFIFTLPFSAVVLITKLLVSVDYQTLEFDWLSFQEYVSLGFPIQLAMFAVIGYIGGIAMWKKNELNFAEFERRNSLDAQDG